MRSLLRSSVVATLAVLAACVPHFHVDPATVPAPVRGADGPRIAPAVYSPIYLDGVGAFRTDCELSHSAPDDPIVFPGEPGAAHFHNFFGNTDTNAYTRLPGSVGRSTCQGGTANRTAYWTPAMVDSRAGNQDAGYAMVQFITGDPLQIYYKSGYHGVLSNTVRPFPVGLRMIAGSGASKAPQPLEIVAWDCLNSGHAQDIYGGIFNRTAIPVDCPAGKIIQGRIRFPQCWDGRNLDSPDHKGHMAYPLGWPDKGCPSTHPVPLAEIIEHFRWRVGPSGAAGYRLVTDVYDGPAGYSFHADWWNGWDPAIFQKIVDNCFQPGLDCRMSLLGDGTVLAAPTP